MIWEDVDNNSPVYVNDSIRTADLSQAVVRLKDGTTIELDENSMILLAETSGAINITFAQGTMYARRAAVAEAGTEKVNIVSGDATVAVEQSDVKLSQSEGKQLDLTVSKGTPSSPRVPRKILTQNQSAVLLKDAPVRVREVPLKLGAPSPTGISYHPREARRLIFWDPGQPEERFGLWKGFSAIVARRRAAGTAARASCPQRRNTTGLKGGGPGGRAEFSEVHKFSSSPAGRALMYPSSGESSRMSAAAADQLPGEAISRQIHAGDREGSGVCPEGELGLDPHRRWIPLPEGTYFWQVSTTAGTGDRVLGAASTGS